jgi:hypothetical protein
MELGKLTQEEKNHKETLSKRLNLLKNIAKELDRGNYFKITTHIL